MGAEYIDAEGSVFLVGRTLAKVAPGLKLSIGDTVVVETDANHFTINVSMELDART